MASKTNPWARRQARRALVQAVYQWQMTGGDVGTVEGQFQNDDSLAKADGEFFTALLRGVLREHETIDAIFAPYLDRKPKDLDQVERAILRLGCFELQQRIDVPYRVVIDEYVELAKTFGAEASYKYINGVLDRVAKDQRAPEWGKR
jgi:N utilization substance protein B